MWEGRYSEDSFADKPWVVRCKSCDARMAIMPEYGDGNYWWIHGDEGVSHMRDVITESWNTRAERTCIPHVEPRALTVDTEPSFYQAICECGWIVGEDGTSNLSEFEHVDSYCGCCGARVVVE